MALRILIAIAALLWQPAAPAQQPGPVLALTDVTLIDGTGAPPRPGMTVIVRGETISDVFRSGERDLPRDGAILNLKGLFLIPGLVSSHDHYMQRGLANAPQRAHAELRRMLYSGVTTSRDMAGDARLLKPLQTALREGKIIGPDIYYTALMAGPDFIALDPRVGRASAGLRRGEPPWMQVITPETDLQAAVERAATTGATGIKFYVGLDGATIAKLTRIAHERGLQVWSHTTVFPARAIEVARAGVDSMSHLCWMGWQDADLDPTKNVPYTHTPRSDPRPKYDARLVETDSPEMRLLLDEMARRDIILDATHSLSKGDVRGCTAELMTGIARAAARAGIPFATGTDYYTPDDDPFPAVIGEIEYLVEQGVLTPLEAIKAATHNGARLVDRADSQGRLAPGMLANMVVLAKDPAADISALRSVVTVFKRGKRFERAEFEALRLRQGSSTPVERCLSGHGPAERARIAGELRHGAPLAGPNRHARHPAAPGAAQLLGLRDQCLALARAAEEHN